MVGEYLRCVINCSHYLVVLVIKTSTQKIRFATMPAFKQALSDQQVLAVIVYYQSFWGDEIYQG